MVAKFRVVIAGCGGMANTWVENAISREDVEIVGLVDIKEEFAQAKADKYGLNCELFTDITKAIEATSANLVFDVTIPESHFQIVTSALKAGCHAFGEKPMASSMEEAREVISVAEKTGKKYTVMQNRRYLKNIRAFRELLRSGAIGKPGFVGADFFLGPHFGGFRDLMDSPLILDMAIHTFDQARFITGTDPVSVYCHEFNPEGSWYKGNAAAVCIFEISDGSVFCYRGSWCAEGAPTSWEAAWRITGSKGTAIWDGAHLPYAEVVVPPSEHSFTNNYQKIEGQTDWNGREGHNGCFDEMFASLLEGRKAETDCTDNIKSMSMVLGAIESARLGQKVLLK